MSVPMEEHDLIVIGGGAAGGGVASAAASAGIDVVLIERDRLGGECLNAGCVPSKAMLRSAEVAHLTRTAAQYGVRAEDVAADFGAVMRRIGRVIRAARGDREVEATWDAQPYPAWHASARFLDARTLEVTPVDGAGAPWRGGPRPVRFRRAVIASGSVAVTPQIPGLAGCGCLTNESLLELRELPPSLLVIGGGPIGVEYGQAFARLGSRVTIVESGTLLAREDPEAGEVIRTALTDEGVQVALGAQLASFRRAGDEVVATLDDDRELRAARVLSAAGRAPRIAGLDLEAADIRARDGALVLDDRLRTSQRHIVAVGDVAGGPPFVHVATYQAELIAANLFHGKRRRVDYRAVPWATFCDPEVGRIGQTEAEARESGADVVIGRVSWDELDRALTDDTLRGFVKIVAARPDGRILGAQVVGAGAGDLVAELALAMSLGATVRQVRDAIHVYPTRSEGVRWACAAVANQLPDGR